MSTYITGYFIVVSFLSAGLTTYDKNAARFGRRRIKERTLLLVSALGGSCAMLITMLLVRHKTKHAKFMVGIPLIIIIQIAAAMFVWWRIKGGAI